MRMKSLDERYVFSVVVRPGTLWQAWIGAKRLGLGLKVEIWASRFRRISIRKKGKKAEQKKSHRFNIEKKKKNMCAVQPQKKLLDTILHHLIVDGNYAIFLHPKFFIFGPFPTWVLPKDEQTNGPTVGQTDSYTETVDSSENEKKNIALGKKKKKTSAKRRSSERR